MLQILLTLRPTKTVRNRKQNHELKYLGKDLTTAKWEPWWLPDAFKKSCAPTCANSAHIRENAKQFPAAIQDARIVVTKMLELNKDSEELEVRVKVKNWSPPEPCIQRIPVYNRVVRKGRRHAFCPLSRLSQVVPSSKRNSEGNSGVENIFFPFRESSFSDVVRRRSWEVFMSSSSPPALA